MNRKQIRNTILILLVCAVVSGAFKFLSEIPRKQRAFAPASGDGGLCCLGLS